jgi:hypothetical protein
MPGTMDGGDKTNLYAVLGVSKAADDKEVSYIWCPFGSIQFHYLSSESAHCAFMMNNRSCLTSQPFKF